MNQKIHPHIFVSYSWDSDNHKDKVKEFVQRLCSDGVDVKYDMDFQLGSRLPEVMENSISNSDIVLFICTPEYKNRADNRISGVGYESQVITGELFETYNETKFIPILFSGTWKTSLPTWAKGKLGIDLSIPKLYETNYQKLLLALQRNTAHTKLYGNGSKHIEIQSPTNKKNSTAHSFIYRIKKLCRIIFNPNTFLGLVLVAIIGGVIVNILEPYISPPSSNTNNQPSEKFSINSIAIRNGAIKNGIINICVIIHDTVNDIYEDLKNKTFSDDLPDDEIIFENTLQNYIIPNLERYSSNGTMPKGSNPVTITITDEIREKLTYIPKLSIGSSKKWIDDKLGAPYAEEMMDIKSDGLMWNYDDENDKIGEILVCLYYIPDTITVQVFFNPSDDSCQAFFVTLLNDISDIDIKLPSFYTPLVSDKSLGEFAFSEIDDSLVSTYGYAGQGIGRTFYGEEYRFGAHGNYQNFYFAVLDYGMLDSRADFSYFLSVIEFIIGPTYDRVPLPDILNSNRTKFYPNTYGISSLNNRLTFDLLSNYYWFDNIPISNWTS